MYSREGIFLYLIFRSYLRVLENVGTLEVEGREIGVVYTSLDFGSSYVRQKIEKMLKNICIVVECHFVEARSKIDSL